MTGAGPWPGLDFALARQSFRPGIPPEPDQIQAWKSAWPGRSPGLERALTRLNGRPGSWPDSGDFQAWLGHGENRTQVKHISFTSLAALASQLQVKVVQLCAAVD
jgi:hypothetical protein